MSELDHIRKHRLSFMQKTAKQEPTLDQWARWESEAAMPPHHRQEQLPGLTDSSLRRGFRKKRSPRIRTSVYSCQRRRPGRISRWIERELRETDAFAVSVLPSAVLEESHLSPADRRVLLALLILSRGREAWTMYIAPIANMARVARSTAHLSVARLTRAGYIGRRTNPVSGARNGPNTWTILDARLLFAAGDIGRSSSQREAHNPAISLLVDRVQKHEPVNHINLSLKKNPYTGVKKDPLHSGFGAVISAKGAAAPPTPKKMT